MGAEGNQVLNADGYCYYVVEQNRAHREPAKTTYYDTDDQVVNIKDGYDAGGREVQPK